MKENQICQNPNHESHIKATGSTCIGLKFQLIY